MSSKPTIYLIDGSGYIFRAFYAIRPLSTSGGLPTNAIYGFTQMIWSFLQDVQPTHAAVVFDTKEPSFRKVLYPEYKANRAAPPEALVPQFPYFRQVVEGLNIPCFATPGFEADDVIGTLAVKMADLGHPVVIITGDKDFMQLVNDKITIWDTMKERRYDVDGVQKKLGVLPEQVIDTFALSGDTSDNVPGVSGVGPKTAVKLIQQWKTLEAVLANADTIKGKLGERLREQADQARLSKRLVTIHTEVPVPDTAKALEVHPLQREILRDLFKALEFGRLLQELTPQATLSQEAYHLVTTEASLQVLASEIIRTGRCAIDTETTGLDTRNARLVGLAIATTVGEGMYIPLTHDYPDVPPQLSLATVQSALARPFADPTIAKVFQNAKFDLPILSRFGLPVLGVACDTMLASYVLNPSGSHGLDAMAEQFLDHTTVKFKDVVTKGETFASVPLDVASGYAAEDVDVTLRLAQRFLPALETEGLLPIFEEIEMPLLVVLMVMEQAGVQVNTEHLRVLGQEFGGRLATLEKAIYEAAGEAFNIASPKQLGDILFGKLQLPGGKRTKTGYSTNAEVLHDLAPRHPLPRLILAYRTLAKLQSTYVEALPKLVDPSTSRIHTDFNQTIAATGRLSSSNPNLQNIPIRTEEGRRIRAAFVARNGCALLAADYSQIELRILAHLSGDEVLCKAFNEDRDVHAETAASLFGVPESDVTKEQRGRAKTVNFGVIYGQTAYGLARQLQIDPAEARDYIERFFAYYPGVAAYRERVLETACKEGKVTTLFGRRRFLPELGSQNGMVRANAERMAFNTVIQGSAADIIKKAMIVIHRQLIHAAMASRMLLQVHDELIFEVPHTELDAMAAFVRTAMQGVVVPPSGLRVPLKVDMAHGATWADC